MKMIDRIVTQDGSDIWRLREFIAKLKSQISLYNNDPEHNLDKIRQLVHEIEFDFSDTRMAQADSDVIAQAHYILKENT